MTKPNLDNSKETFGYIVAKLENIHEEQKRMNGDVKILKTKVQKHDVLFGKIGVAMTFGIFILTVVFNSVIDFVRHKFIS